MTAAAAEAVPGSEAVIMWAAVGKMVCRGLLMLHTCFLVREKSFLA